MDFPDLSISEIQSLRDNFTVSESQQEHLERCWSHQTCGGCMDSHQCSWCPFTWSCVPNSYKIPMLAPAYDENVCPHWAERWEIRTQPFGCQVSTITSLTSIISIVSTLVFVLLVFLTVLAVRRLRRYSKDHPGWWRSLRYRWWNRTTLQHGEREPLLPDSQPSHTANHSP